MGRADKAIRKQIDQDARLASIQELVPSDHFRFETHPVTGVRHIVGDANDVIDFGDLGVLIVPNIEKPPHAFEGDTDFEERVEPDPSRQAAYQEQLRREAEAGARHARSIPQEDPPVTDRHGRKAFYE